MTVFDDFQMKVGPAPEGTVGLSERLDLLRKRERTQAIELRGRFAEQEHGLRQRYGE
jgi:hypothetical protein